MQSPLGGGGNRRFFLFFFFSDVSSGKEKVGIWKEQWITLERKAEGQYLPPVETPSGYSRC